jgi:predicted dehydrogenase
MKKVALVGYGYWGKNHLRTLKEIDSCKVSYVCDPALENDEDRSGLAFTRDYNRVLNDNSLDGVIIVTPTKTHYSLAKEFLRSGKHVFVEKPLTTRSFESKELCTLADKEGKCLMVGEIFRFNPAVIFMKSFINAGELGDLRYIESRRVGLGPVRNDVSVLWDLATHDVYISNLLVGASPDFISCMSISHNGRLDDIVCMNMNYPSLNMLSTVYANWEHPIKERLMIIGGTKKAIRFDDVQPSEKIAIYERGVDYQPATGDFGEFQAAIRGGGITLPNLKLKQPLEEELKHFLECFDDPSRCRSSGWVGFETVKVLEAAEKSILMGGIRVKNL